MPRKSASPDQTPDIKVFIRNSQGKYLAQDANGWFFSENRAAALVFDYQGDAVQEQIEGLQKSSGVLLAADPVPPEEIYETCDRCKDLFMPFMTFFDGKQFLCTDCRRGVGSRKARA